jgi:hypothetical protein
MESICWGAQEVMSIGEIREFCLVFRVWGLGFGVWCLGFSV